MRNITKYTLLEWLTLAPLTHCLKQIRNDVWQKIYCRKPADDIHEFLVRTKNLQHIGIVIAFEQPWALSWQLRMAKINVQSLSILVFDNSRSAAKRSEIKAVCDKNQIPYLALPANNTKHPNRSHGTAMNWIYKNIIQEIQPETYIFLDHDLIPVLPVSYPPKAMDSQPLYGMMNVCQHLQTWHLWAGYCAFNYREFSIKKLNFLYDFSNGLDTGGRNWNAIYKHLSIERIQAAPRQLLPIRDPVDGKITTIEIIDGTWFHIGGIGYNDHAKNKIELCQHLDDFLNKSGIWNELINEINDS